MHPLDGSFLKLRRADEHLQVINDVMQGFLKSKPYRIVNEFVGYGQTRECLLRFEHVEDIPPSLPLLIGDACNNLRSALDHLIWQLWLLREPLFTRNVKFPIWDDESRFKVEAYRDIGRSANDGLSDVQRATIESLQPYKTRNPALSFLRDVNDSDKHRLIQVVVEVAKVKRVRVIADPARALLQVPLPHRLLIQRVNNAKIENGTILARIPLNRFSRGSKMTVKSSATVEYAFKGSKTANGQLIDTSINAMLFETLRTVTIFESEFASFGTSKFK